MSVDIKLGDKVRCQGEKPQTIKVGEVVKLSFTERLIGGVFHKKKLAHVEFGAWGLKPFLVEEIQKI